MKRNYLVMLAVITSLFLTAFTKKYVSQQYYLVYHGGPENQISSYDTPTTFYPGRINDGIGALNWLMVEDEDNDGIIDPEEFNEYFELSDVSFDSSNKLSDEAMDRSGVDVFLP